MAYEIVWQSGSFKPRARRDEFSMPFYRPCIIGSRQCLPGRSSYFAAAVWRNGLPSGSAHLVLARSDGRLGQARGVMGHDCSSRAERNGHRRRAPEWGFLVISSCCSDCANRWSCCTLGPAVGLRTVGGYVGPGATSTVWTRRRRRGAEISVLYSGAGPFARSHISHSFRIVILLYCTPFLHTPCRGV